MNALKDLDFGIEAAFLAFLTAALLLAATLIPQGQTTQHHFDLSAQQFRTQIELSVAPERANRLRG